MTLRDDSRPAEDIKPWDSDHTALVHVLWAAQRGGIAISDPDMLAAQIIGSKWMRAVRHHAVARAAALPGGGA